MSSALKAHLPIIILVSVLGAFSAAFFLSAVRDNAAMFNAGMFTFLLIAIPCVVMVVCSFIIMLTTKEIGSKILIIVEAICLACGLAAAMVVTVWEGDAAIVSAVLANSDPGAHITPAMNGPISVVRNVMLYLLCPLVGSVLGAWLGSRLHPVSVDAGNGAAKGKNNKKKRQG